jgi:hypothetical protein
MSKTRFFLICIFLCVTFSINRIYASDNLSKALGVFSRGQFFSASIEFERAIFYETDKNIIAECKYYKSCCYQELGETQKALNELNSINLFKLPDSLYFLIRYKQALCNYLSNDPEQSLLNIEEIKDRFRDSLKTDDIIPLNILCLNAVKRWDDAFNLWNSFLDNSGLQDSARQVLKTGISLLYKKEHLPKFRSPRKAQNLSRFIPGSGQMYCGNVLEGSFNLLMNASILSYAFYEFYTHYYFTGYFIGLSLFNKTYTGGMHRAYLLAEEKNLSQINNFNRQNSSLLIILMNSRDKRKSYGRVY